MFECIAIIELLIILVLCVGIFLSSKDYEEQKEYYENELADQVARSNSLNQTNKELKKDIDGLRKTIDEFKEKNTTTVNTKTSEVTSLSPIKKPIKKSKTNNVKNKRGTK